MYVGLVWNHRVLINSCKFISIVVKVHIDRNGERYGPYSIEDINAYLANGTLLPTDLACQDGMDEWVPVSQISGVVMAGGSGTTSVPSSRPVPTGNKKKILIGIGAGMGLLVLAAGIWFFFVRTSDASSKYNEEVAKIKSSGEPTTNADWNTWHKAVPTEKNSALAYLEARKSLPANWAEFSKDYQKGAHVPRTCNARYVPF